MPQQGRAWVLLLFQNISSLDAFPHVASLHLPRVTGRAPDDQRFLPFKFCRLLHARHVHRLTRRGAYTPFACARLVVGISDQWPGLQDFVPVKQDFVPVKPVGHKMPTFQPRFCDTQNLMADNCFHPANNHFDQLSSPFSSPELAFTTAAVPSEFKPEEPVKPNSTPEDYIAYEPSDISLETASSTERALFAGLGKYRTEVSSHCNSARSPAAQQHS